VAERHWNVVERRGVEIRRRAESPVEMRRLGLAIDEDTAEGIVTEIEWGYDLDLGLKRRCLFIFCIFGIWYLKGRLYSVKSRQK